MKLRIPPPIQTLIAALAMLGGCEITEIRLFEGDLALGVVVILCFMAVSFLLFAILGFIKLKTTINPLKPETTSSLVTNGVYRFSRNPMYAGMALLLMAWVVWLANPFNLIIFVLFISYITHFQIKPEEKALSKLFGDQFELYCQQVRRWL